MEKSLGKINKVYAMQIATIFIGFVIFGFSENIKGPAIPRIQFDFMLSESQLGTLLALNAIGYLIACSFTAYFTGKWGIKRVMVIAFTAMALSGILIFISRYYSLFAASYFLMYIGNGMLEIGLAILGARIFVKNTGTMMNLANGFYGISSTVAPLIAAGLMEVTIGNFTLDWRGMYLVILLLSVVPILFTCFSTFPQEDSKRGESMSLSMLLKDPILWLMVCILTFGVVSELAVGGWLVNFLEKSYGWDNYRASGLLSAFFLLFTLARLFLGPITDKIGFTLSLIIFSGFSALCTFGAVLGGENFAYLFAVSGIGIAMVYPTVMAFLAKRYSNESETAITLAVTIMGLGSAIGNYIIGDIIEVTKRFFVEDPQLGLLRGLQAG
ncbi:MFS transporter, partial [Neobacillus niacini]|uniref:MFS transporter n=1 Tax=Neobacillus niacini TaxID=86668 RepID=UPI002FFD8961